MRMRKLFVCVGVFLFLAAALAAQAGQTGSIKGIVTLEDGSLLPGVAVTLKSPALVKGEQKTVTNESGAYHFMFLSPGTYEVTFDSDVAAKTIRKGIVVNANVNITVNMVMKMKSIEQFVVVEGKAPTIDRQSVTNTNTIDSEFLKALPTQRDAANFIAMTPGITGGANSISSNGATVRDNSYNIDGVQSTDPVVGNSGARFSMEIVDEISVQTGGLNAEFGSVKGAMVNVVTKSGGNKFSGSVNAYFNHEDLKSDNTKGTPLEGKKTGSRYEIEPGLNIGGPIIKNKLWFFLNGSMKTQSNYAAGFPYNEPEQTPIKTDNYYPYLKFTFQPDADNKFIVSGEYSKLKTNYDGASKFDTKESVPSYNAPEYVLSGHWIHTVNNRLFTTLKVGVFQKKMDWVSNGGGSAYWEYQTGLNSRNIAWGADKNTRRRIQGNLDGTWFLDKALGSHEIKFGVQSTLGYGLLDRSGLNDPDMPKDSVGIPRINSYTDNGVLYQGDFFVDYKQESNMLSVGAFINDTWNLNKHLTVNLGVRVDHSNNYIPKHDNSNSSMPVGNLAHVGFPDEKWDMTVPEKRSLWKWTDFSPRLGMIYDLFGNGSTLFKANFSRYLQENYTFVGFELHPVNWVGYSAYLNPDGSFDSISYTWITAVNTKVGYKNHKLTTPYTNELALGLERELWNDFSVKATYTRRWERNLIEDVDASYLDLDALMDRGELIWKNYVPVQVVDPHNGKSVTFWSRTKYMPSEKYIVNPPGAKRDYSGLEIEFSKRFSRRWGFNASYVFAKSTGLIENTFWGSETRTGLYNNPNAHVNAEGRMPMERRHQFKFQGLVSGPLGINLSTVFQVLAGYRYSRTINSKELGYDKKIPNPETIMAEARGAYGYPTFVKLDLRLTKQFRFGEVVKLELFCDVFNALNSHITTWVEESSSKSYAKFGTIYGIMNPRIFQLGTRLTF